MSNDLQLRLRVHSNPAWAADEIERLHAEVAAQDKELCEMAQHCDDLSCENARLQAKLTITDEKIELARSGRMLARDTSKSMYRQDEKALMRAALLAAGMEAPDGKP